MSWYNLRTTFLLNEKYPNLKRAVVDGWIWDAMNIEHLPHGWDFTETDSTSNGEHMLLVFEIDHGPRLGELAAVEALLGMMEQRYGSTAL